MFRQPAAVPMFPVSAEVHQGEERTHLPVRRDLPESQGQVQETDARAEDALDVPVWGDGRQEVRYVHASGEGEAEASVPELCVV